MSPERATPNVPIAIRSFLKRIGGPKLAAAGGATLLALALAVGAGAAPSPIEPFAEVLGLSGEHGAAVSQAVDDARTGAQEAGERVGPAVSEAACSAAHDRTTLPEGAQNAPGQQDREPKDCTHPSNAEDDVEEAGIEDGSESAGEHGKAVSQAVHDAKAAAKEAGEKVGPAVSEAACTAAHDRSTLPEGAQNASGQQDREPKDCTHPSNVDDGNNDPTISGGSSSSSGKQHGGQSNGHGKDSAPGQQKKQND